MNFRVLKETCGGVRALAGTALRRKAAAGVTLVELLVVITIVAILMAIGVPSFRNITNSNRVAAEVNGLLGDLQFARSEAIKEGATISVCAANNPTATTAACAGTNWQTGWVVFVDVNGSGAMDSTSDTVLRVRQTFLPASDTFTADDGQSVVTFNREGFATGLQNGTATLKLHTSPANTGWTRCLLINMTGYMTTQVPTQGSCT